MTPTHLRQNGVTVSMERREIGGKFRRILNILWAVRMECRLSLGFHSDCPFRRTFPVTARLFAHIRRLFRHTGLRRPVIIPLFWSLLKEPTFCPPKTGRCSLILRALFLQASQKCTFLPLAGDAPDPNAACGREAAPALPEKTMPEPCVSPRYALRRLPYYNPFHTSPQGKNQARGRERNPHNIELSYTFERQFDGGIFHV